MTAIRESPGKCAVQINPTKQGIVDGVQVRAVGVQVRESIGPRLPEEAGPNVELTNRYGSGTSAVTLPISSNSVFEVYSFT